MSLWSEEGTTGSYVTNSLGGVTDLSQLDIGDHHGPAGPAVRWGAALCGGKRMDFRVRQTWVRIPLPPAYTNWPYDLILCVLIALSVSWRKTMVTKWSNYCIDQANTMSDIQYTPG